MPITSSENEARIQNYLLFLKNIHSHQFSTDNFNFVLGKYFFLSLFFSIESCTGVSAWRSYEKTDLADTADVGELWSVNYTKQSSDTIMRVTFESLAAVVVSFGCSEWYITIDENECNDPAPVVTMINSQQWGGSGTIFSLRPMVLSGFCKATSTGYLSAGTYTISANIRACTFSNPSHGLSPDSHTGIPTNLGPGGQSTSTFFVEEYCQN